MSVTSLDPSRNQCMLTGKLAKHGYDWWWHSFTAHHAETGEELPFFIEFFLINPERGSDKPTFGRRADGTRGATPSYLMVKAGCWGQNPRQLHRFFPISKVDIGLGTPYYLYAGDCLACDTDLIGHVHVTPEAAAAHPEWMSDAGCISFDLHLDKQIAFNVGYGASKPARDAQAFEMYWHAEGMKTLVSGTIMLDGETYEVTPETSFGYSDKNWGSDFTSPWVWLASSDLTSRLTGNRLEDTAFDIGGGRPRAFGVTFDRKLLGCISYEGRAFEFNFSKPWTLSQTAFDCQETETEIIWHVQQDTATARMITDVCCPKNQMILANYESPDGFKRHNRLFNGGAGTGRVQLFEKHGKSLYLIDDMDAAHIGCEFGEYDQE